MLPKASLKVLYVGKLRYTNTRKNSYIFIWQDEKCRVQRVENGGGGGGGYFSSVKFFTNLNPI